MTDSTPAFEPLEVDPPTYETWMDEALCAQSDPELWFPEKGGTTRHAKAICRECPVIDECLRFAIDKNERFGIYGGLSERERRRLVKRQEGVNPANRAADERRFWSKVDKSGDCWLWTGEVNNHGYGIFTTWANNTRTKHLAHRYAVATTGDRIVGVVFRHTCDNPPCVRPDHLLGGTQADNIHDAMAKGRLDTSGLLIGQFGSTRELKAAKSARRRAS